MSAWAAAATLHQNVAQEIATVRLRVIDGGRMATAVGDGTDPDGLRRLIETARTLLAQRALLLRGGLAAAA